MIGLAKVCNLYIFCIVSNINIYSGYIHVSMIITYECCVLYSIIMPTFSLLFTLRILFPMLCSSHSPSRHSMAEESSETGSSRSKYSIKTCMLC